MLCRCMLCRYYSIRHTERTSPIARPALQCNGHVDTSTRIQSYGLSLQRPKRVLLTRGGVGIVTRADYGAARSLRRRSRASGNAAVTNAQKSGEWVLTERWSSACTTTNSAGAGPSMTARQLKRRVPSGAQLPSVAAGRRSKFEGVHPHQTWPTTWRRPLPYAPPLFGGTTRLASDGCDRAADPRPSCVARLCGIASG